MFTRAYTRLCSSYRWQNWGLGYEMYPNPQLERRFWNNSEMPVKCFFFPSLPEPNRARGGVWAGEKGAHWLMNPSTEVKQQGGGHRKTDCGAAVPSQALGKVAASSLNSPRICSCIISQPGKDKHNTVNICLKSISALSTLQPPGTHSQRPSKNLLPLPTFLPPETHTPSGFNGHPWVSK